MASERADESTPLGDWRGLSGGRHRRRRSTGRRRLPHAAQRLIAALVLTLAVGWSFAGLGLAAWVRWPNNLTGPLMVAVGLTWFARAIGAINDRWAFEIGTLVGAVYLGVLGHLILTYPSGRLESRAQKVVVAAAYLCTLPLAFVSRWLLPDGGNCSQCPFNQLVGDAPSGATNRGDQVLLGLVLVVTATALTLMALRWRAATPASRRSLAPALWGATAILGVLVIQRLGVLLDVPEPVATFLSWCLTGVAGVLAAGSARRAGPSATRPLSGRRPGRRARRHAARRPDARRTRARPARPIAPASVLATGPPDVCRRVRHAGPDTDRGRRARESQC